MSLADGALLSTKLMKEGFDMSTFITESAILGDNKELRPYECLRCGHYWYEDCDASDYPNYCPGCGGELIDDESEV